VSEGKPSNVINLMDALRRSARGGEGRRAAPARKSNGRKRAAPKAPRRKVRRAS